VAPFDSSPATLSDPWPLAAPIEKVEPPETMCVSADTTR
jgi:hypothetical protein